MPDAATLLTSLSESCELECKRAQGRDGQGKLPDDFWPSYSAFANSRGGVIVLEVREKPNSGSHAPAWEQAPTLQRRVCCTGRWSVPAAFPRWSVGTRA